MKKSYSLFGPGAVHATEMGLANPKWFRPSVDPKDIRRLMIKDDARATRDTALWLGMLLLFAVLGILMWPSWWSVPIWLAYGVLYGSASDSRWHECGHRTAFATAWKNEVVYQIASFMLMRNPVVWRASHVRHHTDTIIVGRDPEIVAMRPPDLLRLCLNLFGIVDVFVLIRRMLLHVSGRVHAEEAPYLRPHDYPAVFFVARVWLVFYGAVVIISIIQSSILPLMLIGLPRLYGAWHHVMTGVLQHLGLAENVTDHRLNTRTVLMNPISRFIYLNMNYHTEHHMFTMVPYYRLPELHELLKHDLPPAEPTVLAAFRRLIPVLMRQIRYEDAVIIPELPEGATPYRDEVNALLDHAV